MACQLRRDDLMRTLWSAEGQWLYQLCETRRLSKRERLILFGLEIDRPNTFGPSLPRGSAQPNGMPISCKHYKGGPHTISRFHTALFEIVNSFTIVDVS
jgi:hypothetical protein